MPIARKGCVVTDGILQLVVVAEFPPQEASGGDTGLVICKKNICCLYNFAGYKSPDAPENTRLHSIYVLVNGIVGMMVMVPTVCRLGTRLAQAREQGGVGTDWHLARTSGASARAAVLGSVVDFDAKFNCNTEHPTRPFRT
jgi:hypothetical protein